jgi:hypothetical protein
MLDQVKAYINPQFFAMEMDAREGNVYDKKNSVFEEQSRIGHATGEGRSPRWVREALYEAYQCEKEGTEGPTEVVTFDDKGNIHVSQIPTMPPKVDDNALG